MSNKTYQTKNGTPVTLNEPAVAYRRTNPETPPSENSWNPNVPFCGTQEEWWEHFHRIEDGEFYPVSEVHQRILQWLDK
ncbi:MAG: hypothetical protein LBB73_00790 [Dysgonamonadaceae bacterium]|jgi:hypothetical protein|nr:hypothetical protein [Dysgonamonadaceae bacterium]